MQTSRQEGIAGFVPTAPTAFLHKPHDRNVGSVSCFSISKRALGQIGMQICLLQS